MFKKIATNTISQIISKAWTAIISIFLISMLTKYFPMHLYWLYSKLYNYLWIFAFLADLWLYTIAIREITNNKYDSSKIIWNIITLRFLLWVIILFLAIWIAYFLPWYNSKLALDWIFIVSIFTIVSLLNSAILALMQANMKIEFSFVSIIAWKLLNIGLISFIIFYLFPENKINTLNISFIYILMAWLAWIILNTFLNYLYARKICSLRFHFDFDYIKKIFKISLPYGIALFLSVVYFKIDIILLSIIETKKEADISIALYSLPMKIVEVLMVVWWFYLNSILPSITKLFKNKKIKELNNLLNLSLKILISFWVFIFIWWSLFRKYLVEIVANKDYLDPNLIYNSADVFPIVLWVLLFYFISLIFIYSLIAFEKQWILLKINIIITIFNIIWNIILIPIFSFMWAWITTIFSQILFMILWFFYTKKIVKLKIEKLFIFKILFIWIFTYFIWYLFLNKLSIWLYTDIILYWFLIIFIYLFWIYNIFKVYIKRFI